MFSLYFEVKILKNKGPDINFSFDLSKSMLDLQESNKKFALACLFMEISVAKVTILSQNHTIFGDKMCFSQTLRWKILKYKGPDVNFLFDLSKTMLVLLESNKKCGLSHLFFEISFAKVAILSQNHTFFVDKMRFPSILRSKI